MCGITAYLGNDNSFEYILSSLKLLQNRGYDSAGICTINNDFILSKYATYDISALDIIEKEIQLHSNTNIGIGHTRWATHGAKTNINAHPHIDCRNKVAIVHNGIIENYIVLKKFLEKNNFTFSSQTDSEVIANLISYYIKQNEPSPIEKAFHELQGTWAVVILLKDNPNSLYLCKNGSPLVIAYDNNFCLVSSEQLPLSRYFNNYISLVDGDIIEISKKDNTICIPNIFNYKIEKIDNKVFDLTPFPYTHWTLKEIHEQSNSITRSLNNGGRIIDNKSVKLGGLDDNYELLKNIEHVIILGCGTSLNAGLIGSFIMKKLKCFFTVQAHDASEFIEDDLPNYGNIVVIVLSQSGETKDIHKNMELIKKRNIPIISIVNVVGSLIARTSTCGIYLNAGREVGVASTKSFTSQVIVLSLLSIWFAQTKSINENIRKQYIKSLRNISLHIKQVLNMNNDIWKKVALITIKSKTVFILGRGEMQYIAQEIALKFKEICYIHAEGYPSGALKHGPFALIDENTLIFVLSPKDEYYDKNLNTIEEINSRKAQIIVLTNSNENILELENNIILPNSDKFNSIIYTIALQLIAYEIALLKGHNPDYPKNLAKVVTVDG